MKKRYTIGIAAIVIVIAAVVILLNLDIQKVSTEKETYILGENIKIDYSNLITTHESCRGGYQLEIYKKEGNDWIRQLAGQYPEEIIRFGCIDGKMIMGNMGCDVIMPQPLKIENRKYEYVWDQKIFVQIGNTTECEGKQISEIFDGRLTEMQSYISTIAQSGEYKIKYGNAEKIITIE